MNDLGIKKYLYISVQRISFDVDTFLFKFFKNVAQTHCGTKIVQDECLHLVKGISVPDLYPAPDILFKYLVNDASDISPFVFKLIILDRSWETSFQDIGIKFLFQPF